MKFAINFSKTEALEMYGKVKETALKIGDSRLPTTGDVSGQLQIEARRGDLGKVRAFKHGSVCLSHDPEAPAGEKDNFFVLTVGVYLPLLMLFVNMGCTLIEKVMPVYAAMKGLTGLTNGAMKDLMSTLRSMTKEYNNSAADAEPQKRWLAIDVVDSTINTAGIAVFLDNGFDDPFITAVHIEHGDERYIRAKAEAVLRMYEGNWEWTDLPKGLNHEEQQKAINAALEAEGRFDAIHDNLREDQLAYRQEYAIAVLMADQNNYAVMFEREHGTSEWKFTAWRYVIQQNAAVALDDDRLAEWLASHDDNMLVMNGAELSIDYDATHDVLEDLASSSSWAGAATITGLYNIRFVDARGNGLEVEKR